MNLRPANEAFFPMTPTIAVAMSGGVDSTVAAYLLKQQGYPVFGIHFITGYETPLPERTATGNPGKGDHADSGAPPHLIHIRRLAERIDIPLCMADVRSEFKTSVVDYFVRTYRSGMTPNPCMICNPTIKFGTVLSACRKLGATHIATGHYAGIVRDTEGRFHLMRGRDPDKEQSYFLAMLSQKQMARIRFPLAMMTKSEVRSIARKTGLADLVRTESQDVCFIQKGGYGQFLNRHQWIRSRPGDIVDMSGRKIGEHHGLHLFTVGQRRGIHCPAEKPYYVVRIDTLSNRLVVGRKKDLFTAECRVGETHWTVSAPASPISVHTRVRYRHAASPSTVYPAEARTAVIRFERPEAAITPGQCAVFYREDEVLGGGWIRG